MRKIVLVVLIGLLFFGCSSAKKDKVSKVPDYSSSAAKYMPLALGNKWTYEVNYFGSKGTVDIEIKATDNEWFVDNKGQKLKIDRRGIRDESRYLLMFPLQKESWISIVDLKTKEVRKTVGVDETVTVSAGTFEGAIKVHTTVELPESKILHSFHYFVAGVGIVKIETAIEDVKEGKMIPQTVTELKKYSVNSAKN
jgi:mannose-6-phosphate isomerase-like protein (cupin superfamily)